jgi:hypothetical protein
MTSKTRLRLALGLGGLVGVAGVVTFLTVWLIQAPGGSCAVHVGMSREAVVRACGQPVELDWRPPDYRDASLLYFFDFYDIDKPSCPGPAYIYGARVVVFMWDGGVATVQAKPASVAELSGADLVGLCGRVYVAWQLALAKQAEARRRNDE